MPRSEYASIPDVGFVNHGFPGFGIEAKPFSAIVERTPSTFLTRPHRLTFHHLMLVTSGKGTHRVDFESHDCRPGTVIHVRPGQIHQYCLDSEFEAHTVLFAPAFVPSHRQCAGGAVQLDTQDRDRLGRAFTALHEEYRGTDASGLSADILGLQLQALLLQLGRQASAVHAGGEKSRYQNAYVQFLEMVELRFMRTRRAQDYARELGCSPKTLHRTCVAMAGLSPKEIIERRVALEAARLLTHTSMPSGELAAELGFSETTNFVKFFRRREGVTPMAFRNRHH